MAPKVTTRPHRGLQALRLGLGVLLSLAMVDAGLRLVEATPLWRVLPVVEPILGHPDRDVGYTFTPGAHGVWPLEHRAKVRINALGLRDTERTLAKPAGFVRVGLVGDSMVEALQVEQQTTFTALAEWRLQADGRKIEVINLAHSGPNPMRHLVRLEALGFALGLDWVAVIGSGQGFLTGELYDDSQNPAYTEAEGGRLVRSYGFRQRFLQRHADDFIGHAFVALYQGSPLVRMLYLHGKKPWREVLSLPAAQAGAAQTGSATGDAACAAAGAALAPHIAFWREHQPARAWAAAMQFLDDFAAVSRSHGVKAVYALRDLPLAPLECAAADHERAELVKQIGAAFMQRRLSFVDWAGAVADVVGSRDLRPLHGFGLHRGEGHLNYDGHRAWAAALVDVLTGEMGDKAGR